MRTKLPLVLSATALAVAVLGTTPLVAIAQNVAFPRSSVGTAQLKRNAVTPAKIAPDAVRAAHVQNGSLLAADFKPGQIPQGPKGDRATRVRKATRVRRATQGPRRSSCGEAASSRRPPAQGLQTAPPRVRQANVLSEAVRVAPTASSGALRSCSATRPRPRPVRLLRAGKPACVGQGTGSRWLCLSSARDRRSAEAFIRPWEDR